MPDLVSHEPATGAELWRGETSDVDAEIAAARAGWARWAARPLTVRIETLRRFANAVRQRHEPFADLIARETGKPLWEAREEVDGVISAVDAAVAAYADRTPQRRSDAPMGGRTAVRHKPHGVIAVMAPYHQPALAAAGMILPALAAGNAVVFLPASAAPASGSFLVERFHDAGVPEDCLRLVIGGGPIDAALATHQGVDGLFFAGSARTAAALRRAFAERPGKLLAVEVGGDNPIVAWDTPDPHAAAAIIVQSAFSGAGQSFTAARRLIVEETLAGPLLETLNKLVGRLIVGAPHDRPAPFMGPVIDNALADRLTDGFLQLLTRGGRAIRHLARLDPERPFLAPGIIDVTGVANRPDGELFGPILQVIRVDDFDRAITEANATRYRFSAALLSQTPALYDRFWAGSRAGVVNWNRPTHPQSQSAPRGGRGLSGGHRPFGSYLADQCAYPVVSSEAEAARAAIGIGLRDE